MPNSIPPSSIIVSQRTTPIVQRDRPRNLMPTTSPTVIGLRGAPMRAHLEAARALVHHVPLEDVHAPSRPRRRARGASGMVMPRSIASASLPASACGSSETKWLTAPQADADRDAWCPWGRGATRAWAGRPRASSACRASASMSGPIALLMVAETLPVSTRLASSAQRVHERDWRRAGASSARPDRRWPTAAAWAACRVAGHEEVPAGARAGARLAQRDAPRWPRISATTRSSSPGDQAVGIGEREQQRFDVEVGDAGLGLGVGGLRGGRPPSPRAGRASCISRHDARRRWACRTGSSRAAASPRYSIARTISSGSCFFAPKAMSLPVFSRMTRCL